ncbi:MAG: F0F1 ATP synthase subunit A [Dehalococcoidia bacterium]|nr:F0F1 ATP synthase subunit A [Dehalococcoidia bacterium]
MGSRGKVLLVVLVGAGVLAGVSFIGGTVGSILAGRQPLSVFAVGVPHLELPAGRPLGSLPVTNTLLASWLTCAVVAGVFLHATRHLRLVPSGLQNLVEYVCEFAAGFIEEMVGKQHERRFFPVIMTVFLFVLGNAWLGLLPGFDTLTVNGVALLRSANTDINVTLMLALFCVMTVEYWGWTSKGASYLGSFFDVRHLREATSCLRRRALRAGMGELLYGVVFLFVGLLEVLGHGVRVLSFSFRLFGNMTAGVILTGVAIFLVPMVVPAAFYGLEVLFGLIQAVIFAGLTAVFGYAAVSTTEH